VGVLVENAACIEAERRRFEMVGHLASLDDAPVALASTSASESLRAVERARGATVRDRRRAFVHGFLANVPVMPFGLTEARAHARLRAGLAGAGLLIDAQDL
jgi:predicted nucleic acid-binding protein